MALGLWLGATAVSAQSIDLQRVIQTALNPPNPSGFRTPTRVIDLPVGEFRLNAPLRLLNVWGLILRGSGPGTALVADFDAPDGAAVELVGSNFCQLENLTIRCAPGRNVGFGLFLGRNLPTSATATPASAGNHFLSRVLIEGSWRQACAANIASECNLWQHCYFFQAGAGAALLVSNGGLPEISVPHGVSTMLEASWQDCVFLSQSATATTPLIRIVKNGLGIVGDLNFRGGGLSCAGPLAAAVSFEAPGAAGQLQDIHFEGMRWETEPALHAFSAQAGAGGATAARPKERDPGEEAIRNFARISVRDCTITSAAEAIFAPRQVLSGWTASNLNLYVSDKSGFKQQARRAAVVAGEFQDEAFRVPLGNAGHLFTHLRGGP